MAGIGLPQCYERHAAALAALAARRPAAPSVLLPDRGSGNGHISCGNPHGGQTHELHPRFFGRQPRAAGRHPARPELAFPDSTGMQDGDWLRQDRGNGDAHRLGVLQPGAVAQRRTFPVRGVGGLPQLDHQGAPASPASGQSRELLRGVRSGSDAAASILAARQGVDRQLASVRPRIRTSRGREELCRRLQRPGERRRLLAPGAGRSVRPRLPHGPQRRRPPRIPSKASRYQGHVRRRAERSEEPE